MKTHNLVLFLTLIVLSLSCSKNKNSETESAEEQNSREVFSSEFTNQIIEDGDKLIDDTIELAVSQDSNVDLEVLRSSIENLEGVASATISEKGSAVLIREKNGAVLNLLIYSKSDSRFIAEETISGKSISQFDKLPPVTAADGEEGSALILAPFQSEFNEDLDYIESRFLDANYVTDKFENEEADLDKFRSSFLVQYDIVYISTHGLDDAYVLGTGERNSTILTGEKSDKEFWDSLPLNEKNATTKGDFNLGVTPDWFEITSNGNFSNTWIFINACHSAAFPSGGRSFSEAFFDLEAAAFNGYTDFIYVPLGEAIGEKAVGTFTSGKSFLEMNELVASDPGLRAISTRLRLNPDNNQQYSSVGLFTSRKNINDSFYLILPENLIGTASISPESGPVGTAAIFTVVIKPEFVDQVNRITFDIDNTNQSGLVMEKIDDSTWEYTNLTAPDDVYPRIDTFAFTAFDSDNNVLGRGSAGFSFTTAPSGKSSNEKKEKWTY